MQFALQLGVVRVCRQYQSTATAHTVSAGHIKLSRAFVLLFCDGDSELSISIFYLTYICEIV